MIVPTDIITLKSLAHSSVEKLGLGDRGVEPAFALEFPLKAQDFLLLLHLEFFRYVEKLGFQSIFLIKSVFGLFVFTGLDTFLQIGQLG